MPSTAFLPSSSSHQQERLAHCDSISEFQHRSSQEPGDSAIFGPDLLPTWCRAHLSVPGGYLSSQESHMVNGASDPPPSSQTADDCQAVRSFFYVITFNAFISVCKLYTYNCQLYSCVTFDELVCCEQKVFITQISVWNLQSADKAMPVWFVIRQDSSQPTHLWRAWCARGQPEMCQLKPWHNLRDPMRPAISSAFYSSRLNSLSLCLSHSLFF